MMYEPTTSKERAGFLSGRLITVLIIAFSGILAVSPGWSEAQSPDELRARYPGEQAVVLDYSMNYTISIKDGLPQVLSDETQQILYLSSASGAYLSRFGFTHSSFHELQQYEAYTRTLSDKKIKVTDFKTTDSKSEGVFYDDVKQTTFDFPAIGAGSVGTLHVTELHKDAHLLSPFFFYRGIPVVRGTLSISCPREMSIKYKLMGIDTGRIAFRKESRHGTITYTFTAKDCPAEKSYPDAPDNNWYSPHVVFYIEKYQDEKGNTVPWLGSPDDLYKLDRSYLSSINKETGAALHRIVDSLTNGARTQEEKARRIYSWVQQNIKYVAFEQGMEGFIPRDANLVCSRRFGDCKDMSSILTVMLNTAGVPAYYTWIGTRNLPYTYMETPLPLVDNHMICTILLNGNYIFLDGTDPSCIFGMPSQGIQDKQALVAINDSTYKILTVPIPDKEKSQLTDSTFLELTPGGLKGNIVLNMTGYYSMHMHAMLSHTQEKDKEEYLKGRFDRGSNKFRLDTFLVGDLSDKSHIRLKAQFTLQDYAKHIGDDWYLNMNLFKFYEHEEIDYPKRTMPVEFNFHYKKKYVVVLKIPPGYQVSYLPKSKSYHNDVWGFDCTYTQTGDNLVFTQEFGNDHLLLWADKFPAWNKVLENLFPLYKETVGLSKK